MISKACKKNCLFCKDFFYVLYFDVKEKILPPLLHQYPKKSWTFYVPPPPSPQPPIINIELRPSTTRIGRHKTHSHTHTHARTHARTHTRTHAHIRRSGVYINRRPFSRVGQGCFKTTKQN